MANLSNINNKFLVTTGGNVLIGQTSAVGTPIFQVTGNSTFAGAGTFSSNIFMSTNGSILRNTGGSLQLQSDSSSIILRSNNTTALTIDTSQNSTFAGNVGIGITPVSRALQVHGATSVFSTMLVSDSASGTTGTGGGIGFQSDQGQGVSVLLAAIQGIKETSTAGDQAGALIFVTKSPSPYTLAERMRIDSSGNVGIGVTTPYTGGTAGRRVLDVGGTSQALLAFSVGGAAQSYFFQDGTDFTMTNLATAGGSIVFQNNGAERMRITSVGNVGIGVTPPSTVLLDLKEADAGSDLIIGLTAGTGARAQIRSEAQSNDTKAELGFYTVTGSSTSEAMRINQYGSVGIGTTNPSGTPYRLTIGDGDIYAQQTVAKITLGQFGSQGDAHFGASGIGSPTVGSQDYGFYSAHNAYRTSTGAWKHSRTSTIPSVRLLGSGGASSGNQGFSFDYSANVGTADITWTNLMKILPSGNVGIGTTGPDSKIQVEARNASNVVYAGFRIGYSGAGSNYFDGNDQFFRNGAGTTNHMYINSSGTVTIGGGGNNTSSSNNFIPVKINTPYSTTASPQWSLQGWVATTDGADPFAMTSGETTKNVYMGIIGAAYMNQNRFSIIQGGAERLTVNLTQTGGGGSPGFVGIGTSSPRAKLEVVGDITIQNGVYTYKAGGNTAGSIAINVDIPVGNEGGAGNVFKIEAGFAHYHGMTYNSIGEWWCTTRGTNSVNTYILNAGTAFAGTWSSSKPTTTTLRVTKSAGTYGGGGKWWVKVTYVPF